MKKVLPFLSILLLLTSCASSRMVTVYFSKVTQNGFYPTPVNRTVKGKNLYRLTLKELIKGSKSREDGNPVPLPATKVLSTTINGYLLTADFSKEIILDTNLIGASSSAKTLALGSIVNTLTEFPEVKRVEILDEGKDKGEIGGRRTEDFWGDIGIEQIFERDETLLHP